MQNSPPRANSYSRWVGPLLALGYFLLCALWTQPAPQSWNDIARVAAIESLAERGVWAIDQSPWFELTQDKVFLNGEFHSDKMPLLSWLASGAYLVMRRTVGASLAPTCAEGARMCAYYPLTLLFIGVPASLLIWLMYSFARAQNRSLAVALIGTLALALATMILPYSLVLNHHLPAAVSLFVAFYLLTARSISDGHRIPTIGFFCALAVSLDPLSGILAVALGVLAVIRFRARALYLVPGALVPLLITAMLDYQIAGTVIPPYLIPSGYAYEGSVFPPTIGGNGTPDDLPQYAFKMFFGAQGLYFYNPILFFALAGLVIVAFTAGHNLRMDAIIIGLGFVALSVYLATRTGNLGGNAYGERWFVQAIPLLMAFVYFAPPLTDFPSLKIVRWVTIPLFAIALLASIFSTYQGARNPWRYVAPPGHPTRDSVTGAIGWRWEVRFPPW
ncbi:MAG: hypothetical protein IT331_05605 [Anaerolineae bacterium]|nr:hypothetical protein [Anaerolineae bacterium]